MSCSLIIDSNLIDERVGFTYSSQQASYPASNALDISKRRRTWRTAGYWSIVAGSNTLVIKDAAAGGNLVATVAAGAYVSDALFFAALKTALEAVSDSTFTITRDATTLNIVITAVLAGAATAFRIIATHASSAAMCGILGYSTAADLTGALSYTADELRNHTSEWLVFDFGFPVSPSALLGVSDQNRPLRISSTATVKLYGNAADAWGAPQVTLNVTREDYAVGLVDQDGLGGTACRYWKLEIVDVDNPYGHVELGAVLLGTHMALSRGAVVFPLSPKGEDLSQVGTSRGGQINASKGAQTTRFPLNFKGLDKESREAVQAVFETYGKHSPFAVALDLDGVFSTSFLKWFKLVRLVDEPSEELVSFNNWSVDWSLREEL